jgi:hypothetical protein
MKRRLIAGAIGLLALAANPAAAEPTLDLGQRAGIGAPEATSYQPEHPAPTVRGSNRADEHDPVFTFNP